MVDQGKIAVTTETGKTLEVVVSKNPDTIWVVLGEGLYNVRCKLTPTNNGMAYVGSVMGRELVDERSVKQVKADTDRHHQVLGSYRPR